ncbi:MAG: 2-hydroxyacyl-CoA dehydratase [Chloroflexi bacterium]|nr:2-hydroxyacyl-CoA dehydratase [Chloroflexota bacterium]
MSNQGNQPAPGQQRRYQGRIHMLQKEVMGRYFDELTKSAQAGKDGVPAVYMLVSGNPVELVLSFDLLPVYPEINALQLGVKKEALPHILRAEDMGYSMDNCAYVKADVGFFFSGRKSSFGLIPSPGLVLNNYVGCSIYLNWFEHLAAYAQAPIFNLDIPFDRLLDHQPRDEDVQYVVKQLKEVIGILERISGKKFDPEKFRHIMELSRKTGELWSRVKHLTKHVPTPYDAFFDAVTLMAPMSCLRGTQAAYDFYVEALNELEERVELGIGVLPEERFRIVIDGTPPWPYLRTFRDLFTRWGAVAVGATYPTVTGIWEFGFRHNPDRPLESMAEHMLKRNYTNGHLLHRFEQVRRYVEEWHADAVVMHSIKSCRVVSAGQGDMREYFAHELGVPSLLVESDIEDPRYFSEAQLRNRIDAFFESLEHKKLVAARAG